jgi:hypothetical protein
MEGRRNGRISARLIMARGNIKNLGDWDGDGKPGGAKSPQPGDGTMADDNDKAEAKKVLLEQAKALDMDVDKRWSVETLAEKVMEAQDAARDNKRADFEAKANTWVVLLRAAFPVEDERHEIGETIKVTEAMADRWYAAGVALPGKAPQAD